MTWAEHLGETLRLAAQAMASQGVESLLVGGFAVNYYGYVRATLDVDFLIAADAIPAAREALTRAGFSNVSMTDNAAFFGRPGKPGRVDLLQVDAATLRQLQSRAITTDVHGCRLRIPALKDLLAMKLFAMKHAGERRAGRDMPDVVQLCVLHHVDLEADVRPLCRQYASDEIFSQVAAGVKARLSC